MTKVGILGCQAVTNEMNCVMIGCLGNVNNRQGKFEAYPKDEPLQLVGVIGCGGCPTAVGADRIWQKVRALTDYGIDALHLSSCMIQLCPFKDQFIETIQKDHPDLSVVEGTHPFHDENAFKTGVRELISQRVVTPQRMNDLVFKRIKLSEENG